MKYLSKLLVVALCLVCGAAQAQTFVVSGQVVDSKTRKPIEFATVQLLNSSNKMVTGMNTDAKGRFVLKTKAAGKYTAKASYVTYKSMEKSVTLSAERDSVDLGLYELIASDVSLNTAVVSATVARVEQKEDTMVYNASAYRTPEGSTLDALVEQLPGVEVSDDGTITWNGKTVVVDDGMPATDGYFPASASDEGALQVKASGATAGQINQAEVTPYFGEGTPAADSYVVPGTRYTTYVLGEGAISFEDIGAKVPYEMARDPKTDGGVDTLYTRQRKVFAPFGISYEKTSQATLSPTDAELANGANWCLVHSGESSEGDRSYIAHKAIPIARILSRG